MHFQTVFYNRLSGQILKVLPNRYVKSKFDKLRECPGTPHEELNFLYFNSGWPLDPAKHKVKIMSPGIPPYVVDVRGIPLFATERMLSFVQLSERYDTIIVDMADSMGDQLLRAACLIEAQKQYPKHRFYYTCEAQYAEVLALCPNIHPFTSYEKIERKASEVGKVKLNGGRLYDPRGDGYNKACVYGTWLNLEFVPYNVKLVIPPDFGERMAAFDKRVELRADGKNVVMQLRSKGWETKCWSIEQGRQLARLIKSAGDYQVYLVGAPQDCTETFPEFINLAGKTTWIETVRLLSMAEKTVCIDSSCLHLSRALGRNYVCLWGETHPQHILGVDPGPGDICDTYTTGKTDIKGITPVRVFNKMFPDKKFIAKPAFDSAADWSQHGEQEIIFKWFLDNKVTGAIVVDVGAFGREMSNSFGLLKLGWRGILIEPSPKRLKILRESFWGFDVDIIGVAASDKAGTETMFLHSQPGHDSMISDWYPVDKTQNIVECATAPLADILKSRKVPKNFDLLSIDTEGYDYKILKHLFETSKYRPRLIVTESTSYKDPDIFFTSFGYRKITKTGPADYGNLIYEKV